MAGATVCVSCATLPMKDRSAAIKVTQCPDCQSTFGLTSYGAAFRFAPAAPPRKRSSPMFFVGAMIGVGLFLFAITLAGLGLYSKEKIVGPSRNVEPQAAPFDLKRVPEVAVDDRLPSDIAPADAKRRIASLINKIRSTNTPDNKDAFVLANIQRRPELAGLPFIMGDGCRLDMNRAQSFQTSVEAVREGMESDSRSHQQDHTPFWNTYMSQTAGQGISTDHGAAALAQILAPENKTLRRDLVNRLRTSNQPNATKAIARAAVFDADGDVRVAAIKAIKEGNKEQAAEVTAVLMQGIRYPMAIVAKRTAQAIIMLDRKDLLPDLADMLSEPAPGDPEKAVVNGDETTVVREVVRVNHHRNCLLCHPPSQTGNKQEVPGVIPIPGNAFPTSPKDAYGQAQSSGEPMIRADTTYLRQDFSVMMPVENAAPWPEMQRFDFLVRSRPVAGKELAALQKRVQERGADFLSENQRAAIRVLTELSGQQDVAPTPAAWQRAIAARD
jgi:hypothetical protein